MPLNIIRNDISKVSADAIVNTANPEVAVGAGVDQTIYEAAGMEELLAERAKIGPMEPGEAAVTPAFGLDAKYIIHTVGPAWRGGDYGEREAVASCYRESLRLAGELGCESIAFPLISTGTYGFPNDEALRIAINEIIAFLFGHDMTVYMVVYSREAFVISGKAFSDIKCYIEDKDVKVPALGNRPVIEDANLSASAAGTLSRRAAAKRQRKRLWEKPAPLEDGNIEPEEAEPDTWDEETRKFAEWIGDAEEAEIPDGVSLDADALAGEGEDDLWMCKCEELEDAGDFPIAASVIGPEELEDVLDRKADSFQQMLFRLIDRKGMTDPEVYKKANLDRKLFSKIRSSEEYLPKKKTVLALAVALELNMDETADLLRRAGIALNPSSEFDLIVGYCIDHRIYNIFDINTYLFEFGQPLLGA